jgi:hypothetical protein
MGKRYIPEYNQSFKVKKISVSMCFGLKRGLEKRAERVIKEINLSISIKGESLSEIESKRKRIPEMVDEELEKQEAYKLLSDEKKWEIKAKLYLEVSEYLFGKYRKSKEELNELEQIREIISRL